MAARRKKGKLSRHRAARSQLPPRPGEGNIDIGALGRISGPFMASNTSASHWSRKPNK